MGDITETLVAPHRQLVEVVGSEGTVQGRGVEGAADLDHYLDSFFVIDSASIEKRQVTVSELATQAIDLAYGVNRAEFAGKDSGINGGSLADTHWKMLFCSHDSDKTNQYGYKAAAFINHNTREILIASAGTVVDYQDVRDDFWLALGNVPNKLPPMQALLDSIADSIGVDTADYTFTTVGHSLGAVMADLTAVEITARKLQIAESRTFENPGAATAVRYAMDNHLFSADVDKETLEELRSRCKVYNASPNLVNITQPQFGSEIHLVLPVTETSIGASQSPAPAAVPVDDSYGLRSFGRFVYKTIGSVLESCSNFLGIDHVVQLKQEHPLGNFKGDLSERTVRVSQWANGVGGKGSLVIDESEGEVAEALQSGPSSGNRLFIERGGDSDSIVVIDGFTVADVQKAVVQVKGSRACSEVPDDEGSGVKKGLSEEKVGLKSSASCEAGLEAMLIDAASGAQSDQPAKVDLGPIVARFFDSYSGYSLDFSQVGGLCSGRDNSSFQYSLPLMAACS